ncbi:MAG: hypothetical protein OEU92_14130 [Alphaproteobacteria bacterium]|nr:hypothetical protein [Alphaproteobacteria bacterium]
MNTRLNGHQHRSAWILSVFSAVGLLLTACGEQTSEESSPAPTTEEQSESSTTQTQ